VAADVAARLHREQTHPDDISAASIAAAMRAAIKEKTAKMMMKLGKMVAVANPALGEEFLKEVRIHLHFFELHDLQSILQF
jgi:hypothetical protein